MTGIRDVRAESLLAHVLVDLEALPVEEHLAALAALNRHDVDLSMDDEAHLTVSLGGIRVVVTIDDLTS